MSGRANLWAAIPDDKHLALIDDALDANDGAHQRMAGEVRASFIEVRAEMHAGFGRCEADSKAQRRLLVGLLISIVASSVGIMFTVLAAGVGG